MAGKMYGLNVTFGNEMKAELVKAVIDYEAAVRGLSRGQAIYALLLEAADVESYPQAVRERLDEIAAEAREHAASVALAVA